MLYVLTTHPPTRRRVGWVEEEKVVRMSYCKLKVGWVGGWTGEGTSYYQVGGWVGGWVGGLIE